MTRDLLALDRPPEARAETVEDLVRWAKGGRIRIPPFQRGLQWDEKDVLKLFDSIYRGLPIGSLLLWRKKAEADRVRLGPIEVSAEATSDGWWVVDGQQRLTSLAAGLGRPLPLPLAQDGDPFVVYFDSLNGRFSAPPRDGDIPSTWVPLPLLLDATVLGEWVLEWEHRSERSLARAAFDAGKRIREYRVPLYIVDTDDEDVLKEIFFRTNKAGKPLEWPVIHDAFYGHQSEQPSTTEQLVEAISDLGMGRLDVSEATACLLAVRGLDVTRTLADHRERDPEVLIGAVKDALPALRQSLIFLHTRCGIPHLRLLPQKKVLEVLVRFFYRHPEPGARSAELLVRWVWRLFLGAQVVSERTLLRRGVAGVTDDEEASVQKLLMLVPRHAGPIALPRDYDARAAQSRLCLLALSSLGPTDLDTGQRIDVAGLFEAQGPSAVKTVVPVRPGLPSAAQGPANRVIHPGPGSLRGRLLNQILASGADADLLASHAISPEAAIALREGDLETFFQERGNMIESVLQRLGKTFAGWGRADRDRPSIRYLVQIAGD